MSIENADKIAGNENEFNGFLTFEIKSVIQCQLAGNFLWI
jgi:hypothetical protein